MIAMNHKPDEYINIDKKYVANVVIIHFIHPE